MSRNSLLKFLLKITRSLPAVPRISGLSNRIVKPCWCFFFRGRVVLPVWSSIKMSLDPCDVVGGNLVFIPQLYDRWERAALQNNLPQGGVFVDVGSNVGAYALWAASCVGPTGKVLAIEADPDNYALLNENVRMNEFERIVITRLGGVADRAEKLRFYRNTSGNKGAHSFVGEGADFVEVSCETLATVIGSSGISVVDVMKLDIEGFEERVLARYFLDVPENSCLRPRCLLVEINGGPIKDEGLRGRLKELICNNGYELLVDKDNSWFRKLPGH